MRSRRRHEQEAQPTFYNTTFSLHRVSPLYIGPQPLDRQRLLLLSSRLREVLVGDIVKGIEVGLALGRQEGEDGGGGGMGRAGGLVGVDVRWVNMGKVLGIAGEGEEGGEEGEDGMGRAELDWSGPVGQVKEKKALHILLRYEMAESQKPALVTITDFLSTTFDCHISSLRLGTRSLVQSWELWISTAGLLTTGGTGKDVVLSLGFYIPPPDNDNNGNISGATGEDNAQEPLGMKSIDVIIPGTEVRSFVRAGELLVVNGGKETEKGKGGNKEKQTWETNPSKRLKLAGRLGEEGWEWRCSSSGDNDAEKERKSPFTEALGKYLDKHLGLNLFHPGVRVTKIACGGFVMSEEWVKVFTPREGEKRRQRAGVWKLVGGLVGKAEGYGGKALA
ncbi:kinetochore complex Sim4 subunit Fta1-domain-containing protein [Pseudoneurospora amorphoporcata]|uniref:Kinetochore complex Sim4 subunit Fta1-domain-containing protein n=1 Tax=Pseudoneurospora amorphoporcata TaxID=241081 RepID=A0AAN6SF49_9PEZI|nr:kinetochore complex Sim4 subunit Fta1-domain-containing protein [Pseudoneurospora amorphoporcata]